MKTTGVRERLKQRRTAFDALPKDVASSRTRPGSMNPRKTGAASTNGGSYQRSARHTSSGSARRRSQEALRRRSS